MHRDVTPFGQPDRERRFADKTLVGEVFARSGNALDAEVALEVVFDFGGRASFAHFGQVLDDGGEDSGGALQQICIDGRQRGLDRRRGLLRVEEVGVDELEERWIQFERLREHLAVDEQAGLEYLDFCQGICGVQNPERGVIQIAARDQPLVRLVYVREGVGRRGEQLQLRIALAERAQAFAERRQCSRRGCRAGAPSPGASA